MAWTLFLALAYTTVISGERYSDYTAAKMPQYGGGDYDVAQDSGSAGVPSDYQDRSPDAPAPLDYKYEEELNHNNEKYTLKEVDEPNMWQKHSKMQKQPIQIDDEDNLDIDKYSSEIIAPRVKSNYGYTKHRPRYKNRHNEENDQMTYRRLVKHSRNRNDDIRNINLKHDDDHSNKKDILDEKPSDFEDDTSFISHGETTKKRARRKPRDRFVKGLETDESDDEEYEDNGSRKGEVRTNPEYSTGDESRRRRLSGTQERFQPVDDEGEYEPHPRLSAKQKKKISKEYNDDYYDMKRVYSLKNKFPMLLRRTSARTPASPTRSVYSEAVWTSRHPHLLAQQLPSSAATTTSKKTSSLKTITSTATTTARATRSTPALVTPTSNLTVKHTQSKSNTSTNLSIAEKSRLSILRKAERKESVKTDKLTKKPPVLLQVTDKMQTLVMVEPSLGQQPWYRAREVSDDTPERLDKVKRLMRHKLVANAKDIRDLTENWDDMVCDYVDTSLLDSFAGRHCSCSRVFVSVVVLFLLYA